MYFSGIYMHQVDEKGRLRFPAKLRGELGTSFVLTKGANGTITVYTKEVFEKKLESYLKYDQLDIEIQSVISELVSYSFTIDEDSQGRFVIPQALKQHANIQKNIVIKGVIDRLEIWSEETHAKRSTNLSVNELMKKLHDAEKKTDE